MVDATIQCTAVYGDMGPRFESLADTYKGTDLIGKIKYCRSILSVELKPKEKCVIVYINKTSS